MGKFWKAKNWQIWEIANILLTNYFVIELQVTATLLKCSTLLLHYNLVHQKCFRLLRLRPKQNRFDTMKLTISCRIYKRFNFRIVRHCVMRLLVTDHLPSKVFITFNGLFTDILPTNCFRSQYFIPPKYINKFCNFLPT